MGGSRGAPGKVVGERVIHVEHPKYAKEYQHKLDEATKASKGMCKALYQKVGALEAMLAQKERELQIVTQDRTRLANLKTPDPAVPAQSMPSPGTDSKEVEGLRFQVGKLKEELAAAYERIRVMTAQAAVSMQKRNDEALAAELPIPVPEDARVPEANYVQVDTTDWKKLALAAGAGAILSLLGAKAARADTLFLPNLGRPATGTTVGASKALDVNVVSGGGGGQTEDTAHASGDEGAMSLCVRNDAGTALAANGDYIPCSTDSSGRLRVDATVSEVAAVADGGALPSEVKVVGGYDGSNVQVVKTDASGSIQVDVESSALPTGASTAANQATANASLSSIDGKITAVNTGAVVVSSSALPTGAATAAKQPALGTAGSASADVISVQGIAGGTALPVSDNGSSLTVDGTVAATQSGTWNITNVSGTVSLPTGAATSANQSTANTSLSNIDTNTGRSPRNANATDSTAATATGAAESEAAPADAVGFLLSADGANTDSIRWRAGGTASATAGHELEPGRDSGVIPIAATLSIFAVSGSQAYQLTWVRR